MTENYNLFKEELEKYLPSEKQSKILNIFHEKDLSLLREYTTQIFASTAYINTEVDTWMIEKKVGRYVLFHKSYRKILKRRGIKVEQPGFHKHHSYKTLEEAIDQMLSHDKRTVKLEPTKRFHGKRL